MIDYIAHTSLQNIVGLDTATDDTLATLGPFFRDVAEAKERIQVRQQLALQHREHGVEEDGLMWNRETLLTLDNCKYHIHPSISELEPGGTTSDTTVHPPADLAQPTPLTESGSETLHESPPERVSDQPIAATGRTLHVQSTYFFEPNKEDFSQISVRIL